MQQGETRLSKVTGLAPFQLRYLRTEPGEAKLTERQSVLSKRADKRSKSRESKISCCDRRLEGGGDGAGPDSLGGFRRAWRKGRHIAGDDLAGARVRKKCASAIRGRAGHLALRYKFRGAGRRHGPLLVAAVGWVLYAVWELLVHVRTPEANIRVDLLVIWPALAVVSAWALFRWIR